MTNSVSNTIGVLSMAHLPLTRGYHALVDDEDLPFLSLFEWCYKPDRNDKGYAMRTEKTEKGKYRKVYLHRQIMQPRGKTEVIFLNLDGLDCRKQNLEIVSIPKARQRHRVRSDSRSGVKGVQYNEIIDAWIATFTRHGQRHYVGSYRMIEEAEAAYNQAVEEYDSQPRRRKKVKDDKNHNRTDACAVDKPSKQAKGKKTDT
jgi:hypothetical protein